jgi:hypothetical protein
MKVLKIHGYLEYDDESMHGDDEESQDWFFEDILCGWHLALIDTGDLGDFIGKFTVEEIK